jgi:hypothetical protein
MQRHIARWSLFTGTFLFIGATALAGTGNPFPGQTTGASPSISDTTQPVPWQRGARFRMACGEDLHRLCYGIQPGGGRLIQCLLSHRVQLSPACTSRLAEARPAPGVASPSYPNPQSAGPPPPSPAAAGSGALRASCGPDVQRLCNGASVGNGGVINCLNFHRIELSPICDAFLKEVPGRRVAPKSGPVQPSKTTPPAATSSAATLPVSPAAIPANNPAAPGKPELTDNAAAATSTNNPASIGQAAADRKSLATPTMANNPAAAPPNNPAATAGLPADNSSAEAAAVDSAPTAAPANSPAATDAVPATKSAATPQMDSGPTTSSVPPLKRSTARPVAGALDFPL